MARILRTQNSYADLEAIWDYIARDDRNAADRLIRQIDEMLEILVETPEMGLRRDELRPGLLCKPVKRNYGGRMSDRTLRANEALEGRPAIGRQRNRWVAGRHFGDTTYGKVSRPVASQIRHAH